MVPRRCVPGGAAFRASSMDHDWCFRADVPRRILSGAAPAVAAEFAPHGADDGCGGISQTVDECADSIWRVDGDCRAERWDFAGGVDIIVVHIRHGGVNFDSGGVLHPRLFVHAGGGGRLQSGLYAGGDPDARHHRDSGDCAGCCCGSADGGGGDEAPARNHRSGKRGR